MSGSDWLLCGVDQEAIQPINADRACVSIVRVDEGDFQLIDTEKSVSILEGPLMIDETTNKPVYGPVW